METRKIGGEECGRNRCRAPIAQLVRVSALIAEDLGFDSRSSHISPSPVTNLTSINNYNTKFGMFKSYILLLNEIQK